MESGSIESMKAGSSGNAFQNETVIYLTTLGGGCQRCYSYLWLISSTLCRLHRLFYDRTHENV